jgi:hypothetical protein
MIRRRESDPTALDEDPGDAVLDGQGRMIVVFSGTPKEPGAERAFVARYLPNGEIDKSFGSGGVSEIPWTTETELPVGVAFDTEGRIVVGGQAVKGAVRGFDFAAARFFPNGVLVTGIAIKTGGVEPSSSMTVVRWTESGAPDPTCRHAPRTGRRRHARGRPGQRPPDRRSREGRAALAPDRAVRAGGRRAPATARSGCAGPRLVG